MLRRAPKQSSPERTVSAPVSDENRRRIRWVLMLFLLLYAAIGLRLTQLHLWPTMKLSAEDQLHIGNSELRAPRGEIFDRNYTLLATQRRVPSLWVDPGKLGKLSDKVQAGALADLVSQRLGMDRAEVLAKMQSTSSDGDIRRFVWIKRWMDTVPEPVIKELLDAGQGALAVEEESVRYYPKGQTGAHVLGFVNRAGEASEGLERAYDKYLKDAPGLRKGRKDVRRRLLPSLTMEYEPAKRGDDLFLTIDSNIQQRLERELDARLEHCKASVGMGIIMDPETGAILAMATRPAFDPNHYDEFPSQLRKNRSVIDVFEPGSSFKLIVSSAAIEHKLITPKTIIDTEGGAFIAYGRRITDTHRFASPIPFLECFAQSSNIAMIKVGALVGPDRFEQWMRRFGFGKRAMPHDLLSESAGLLNPRSKWSRISMRSLPIGQEIAVTMPQLVRAYAVVANGGFLVDPYIVERAVSVDGDVTYQHSPPARNRILSESTAATMRELCHQVVLQGTGKRASIDEYRVGGKTGTAQIASATGGYESRRYTSVFVGFAPVNHPRLVGVVAIQDAEMGKHHGGYACAPVFKEVARDALVLMNVPKDPTLNGPMIAQNEDLADDTPVDAMEAAALAALQNSPSEDSGVKIPEVSSKVDNTEEKLMETLNLVSYTIDPNSSEPVMPDLTGKSKREARDCLWRLGIPWDTRGAGRVVSQEPPAGTLLKEVSVCALAFDTATPDAEGEAQDDKAGEAAPKKDAKKGKKTVVSPEKSGGSAVKKQAKSAAATPAPEKGRDAAKKRAI